MSDKDILQKVLENTEVIKKNTSKLEEKNKDEAVFAEIREIKDQKLKEYMVLKKFITTIDKLGIEQIESITKDIQDMKTSSNEKVKKAFKEQMTIVDSMIEGEYNAQELAKEYKRKRKDLIKAIGDGDEKLIKTAIDNAESALSELNEARRIQGKLKKEKEVNDKKTIT